MSNIAIRAVQLKGGQQTFRPLKLPTWAPPGQQALFDTKRMGQKKSLGAFSWDALPTSIATAVGSVGAIFIGSVGGAGKPGEPFPIWRTVLIGGGLIGLGVSIWNLFSGEDVKKSGEQAAGEDTDISSEEVFNAVTGRFLSPKMYEQTSYWTNANANLFLSNPSPREAGFILIVHQYEAEAGYLENLRQGYGGSPVAAKYNYVGKIKETSVKINAGKSTTIPFEVDSDTLWPTAIKLIAEKVRIAGEAPVKLAEVLFYG